MDIANCIIALEEQKKKAQENLRHLSAIFTKQSDDPENPPHHMYSLRGVSTTHNVTYVLHSESGSGDEDDAGISNWQWWRISYSKTDANMISTKVS
jgi:hypothetical protein